MMKSINDVEVYLNSTDIDRAKHLSIDSMSADDLKKLNKNKKLIKSMCLPHLVKKSR
jgi:hypothetical protein